MASEFHIEKNILEREAHLFSNYLINREPVRDIVERYISANRKLGIDIVSKPDTNILRFSLNHPWSIPFLDAASGFIHKESLLRKKIYTMAAVLEASTRHTDEFLPKPLSAVSFAVLLLNSAVSVCFKVLLGIPLLLYVKGDDNA